jgi:hypothetical protein
MMPSAHLMGVFEFFLVGGRLSPVVDVVVDRERATQS